MARKRSEQGPQGDVPILRTVDLMIEHGLRSGANEIHLCPITDGRLEVKHRKNGRPRHVTNYVPSRLAVPVVTRIKIMSGCLIGNKTQAQHGKGRTLHKIRIGMKKQFYHFETVTVPGELGEGVIIKFLN